MVLGSRQFSSYSFSIFQIALHIFLTAALWSMAMKPRRTPFPRLVRLLWLIFCLSFTLATKFFRENESESTVTDLCHIVTYTRSCASRLGELAKFLLNIRLTRRRNHRHLTSNGPNGRVRLLRRLVWDSWRNALTPEH